MSLGDRLGLVGVILALIAMATPYLWPDKKRIGWGCVFAAIILLLIWGWIEFGEKVLLSHRVHPYVTGFFVFIGGGLVCLSAWLLVLTTVKEPIGTPKGEEVESKPEAKPLPEEHPRESAKSTSRTSHGQSPHASRKQGVDSSREQNDDLLSQSSQLAAELCSFFKQWMDTSTRALREAEASNADQHRTPENANSYKMWKITSADREMAAIYRETYQNRAIDLRGQLLANLPGVANMSLTYSNISTGFEMRDVCEDFSRLVDGYRIKISRQQALPPRRIHEDHFDTIVEALNKTPGILHIEVIAGSEEALRFGEDWRKAAVAAKWTVNGITQAWYSSPWTGVHITVKGSPLPAGQQTTIPDAHPAASLGRALQMEKATPLLYQKPDLAANEVVLEIGLQPQY